MRLPERTVNRTISRRVFPLLWRNLDGEWPHALNYQTKQSAGSETEVVSTSSSLCWEGTRVGAVVAAVNVNVVILPSPRTLKRRPACGIPGVEKLVEHLARIALHRRVY